jgi:predicted amidohydrolase
MRIAALQMRAAAGDTAANLARIERAAREAADGGARLLIAPELAVTGYGSGESNRRLAEPADGPTVARLAAISAETGVAIVAGFSEKADGKVWNSAVFVDGGGSPSSIASRISTPPTKRICSSPARPRPSPSTSTG